MPSKGQMKSTTLLVPSDGESSSEEEFEVENIVDCRVNEEEFLIKWRGWHKSENSWEPVENIHCPNLLKKYRRKKTQADFVSLASLFARRRVTCARLSGKNQFSLVVRPTCKVQATMGRQLRAMKTWEGQINQFLETLKKGSGRIYVENNVDLEGPPNSFEYIGDYVSFIEMNVQSQFLVGCTCGPRGCWASSKNCCPKQWGADFAYSKDNGRMRLGPRRAIYECNDKCSCDNSCINRLVQKGTDFHLIIYKTNDGRGWGVKCQTRIKPGAFVIEYLGEIIKTKDVHERAQNYSRKGIGNYLMELDFSSDSGLYSIDATLYGNASRFINHSCDPNLDMQMVFINNVDRELPRIAFFANREIAKGEELTFDYGSIQLENEETRQECHCKSANCRGFLFWSNENQGQTHSDSL